MFDVEYKGGNTIIISTKKGTLVTDPKTSVVGLKDTVEKDAVEVATEERFALNSPSAKLSIEGPGEYEVNDFSVRGIASQRHIDTESEVQKCTVYRIEVGDVRIGLLGNIADKLNDDQLEALGVLDILVIPVGGGGYTLDATAAANLTRRIDPKVVIPVHYGDKALKYEVPQDGLPTFISELGAPQETIAKYKVKSASSIPQTLTVLELTRS